MKRSSFFAFESGDDRDGDIADQFVRNKDFKPKFVSEDLRLVDNLAELSSLPLPLNPHKVCQCNPYSPFIRAGPFVLGTQLNDVQFVDLDQFIAKKLYDPDPNRYYLLKIVVLPSQKEKESYSQRQAKLLLFNEYSVLSLLEKQDGVVHHKGFYIDYFYEKDLVLNAQESGSSEADNSEPCNYSDQLSQNEATFDSRGCNVNENEAGEASSFCSEHVTNEGIIYDSPTKGHLMRRIILALECFLPHLYCSTIYPLPKLFSKFTTVNAEYENLQEYVKRYKTIPELRTLLIFKQIVNVIYDLHKRSIAHRDLRLENILYNHRTEKIILVNFGLSRYVINDSIFICDHRGSSAYISPDVLKRRPYNPKASDCWALGIILYTMLFGKFPFYADSFPELFKKINSGHFSIPSNVRVWKDLSEGLPLKTDAHSIVITTDTMDIIESLIVTDANKRMNIVDLKHKVHRLLQYIYRFKAKMEKQRLLLSGKRNDDDLQVVPNIDVPMPRSATHSKCLAQNHRSSSICREKSASESSISRHFSLEKLNRCSRLPPRSALTLENKLNLSIKIDDVQHDHNYTPNAFSKSNENSFLKYLKSRGSAEFGGPPPSISMYSAQQGRFYYRDCSSVYSFENYSPLLLLEPSACSKNNAKSGATGSAAVSNNASHNAARSTRYSNKGFVRLGSKMARSNFTVLRIDGDIRPLNETEKNIVNRLACQINSQ